MRSVWVYSKFLKTREYSETKIVQPTQSIHYANCDEFQAKLNQICPLRDAEEQKTLCQNVFFYSSI
jgi:hypothetical protein